MSHTRVTCPVRIINSKRKREERERERERGRERERERGRERGERDVSFTQLHPPFKVENLALTTEQFHLLEFSRNVRLISWIRNLIPVFQPSSQA